MTNKQLFEFVQELTRAKPFSLQTIKQGLKQLPPTCHELFLLLINHKNGKDFLTKLNNGEI